VLCTNSHSSELPHTTPSPLIMERRVRFLHELGNQTSRRSTTPELSISQIPSYLQIFSTFCPAAIPTSVGYFSNGHGSDFASPTDMILGPKVNDTTLAQISNGTVESCDALLYCTQSHRDQRSIRQICPTGR
jgi:hypothetical protein